MTEIARTVTTDRSGIRTRSCATLIVALGLLAMQASAAVQVPAGLSASDREEAVRILGFGTSCKILSDPYPLGGYEGFEIGVSVENIPVEDLGRLGEGLRTPQRDIAYPKFTIGKGLYKNVDAFVHFNPYSGNTDLSQYGGILRWGFYQARYLPFSASLLIHTNSSNINNQIATRSYGADLMGGLNVNDVVVFGGGGPMTARGRFIGGPSSVNASKTIETTTVTGAHLVFGAGVHFSNLFLAAQVDRYNVTVYSAKAAVRF